MSFIKVKENWSGISWLQKEFALSRGEGLNDGTENKSALYGNIQIQSYGRGAKKTRKSPPEPVSPQLARRLQDKPTDRAQKLWEKKIKYSSHQKAPYRTGCIAKAIGLCEINPGRRKLPWTYSAGEDCFITNFKIFTSSFLFADSFKYSSSWPNKYSFKS